MATVLIVDDDPALRDGLAETVSDLGHRPLLAASGEEALTRLGGGDVNAVLLDLRMQGALDGMAVLARIRERPQPPPVTVLTAFASPANTIEAMRLGACDHLPKPVGREQLRALLGRMLPEDSAPSTGAPPPAARDDVYDVAIVGGGPAGLSAAVWLGRYLHRVALIDSGDPRNWETRGVNGYLGLPGIRPAELRGAGRREARGYGVELIDGFVARARSEGPERFVLEYDPIEETKAEIPGSFGGKGCVSVKYANEEAKPALKAYVDEVLRAASAED